MLARTGRYDNAGLGMRQLRLRVARWHRRRWVGILHVAMLLVGIWLGRGRILAVCGALGGLRRPVVARVHGERLALSDAVTRDVTRDGLVCRSWLSWA